MRLPRESNCVLFRLMTNRENADLSSKNTLTRITTSNPFRAGNCTDSQLISMCVESGWSVETSAES